MPCAPAAPPYGPVKRPACTIGLRVLTAVAVTAAAGTLAACGSSKASTSSSAVEKPDLTVAVVPASGAAGLYIAAQDGYFTAAGLHVKIVPVASGGDVLANLVNGSVDVDEGQWTSDIDAQVAGIKLHALAAGNAGGPGVQEVTVPPGSGIRTVKQLAGKTIAVNALAGLTVLLIDTVLAANGMSPSQVHYVVVPFPAMAAALAARRVDAAFLIEPYLTQAETSSGGVPLVDLDQGATQNFPLTGYVATQAWMSKYPRTAAAFTRALHKGQQIAATSRPAVEKALTANTTISKQTAAIMATGSFPLSVTAVALGRVADLMQEQHALNPRLNVTALAREMTAR